MAVGALLGSGCAASSDGEAANTTAPAAPTTTTAAVAAVPSAGCTAPSTADPGDRIEVTVDGTARSALVHVPPDPGDRPLPVVVSFHGVDGNASVQQATDGLLELADEEGIVVVHPEGLLVGLNDAVTGITGWDADGSDVDEPAFVAAVLDELAATRCIDAARVFLTGFSAGGNIARVVACALPERVAAVASVAGAFQPVGCEEPPPMPTLAFQGDDDRIVPARGRTEGGAAPLLAARDVLTAQAEVNGCDAEPAVDDATEGVRRVRWEGCDEPTELVELAGHGHAWPGRPMPFDRSLLVGLFAGGDGRPPSPLMVALGSTPDAMADDVLRTNVDVDATAEIWAFLDESVPR